MRSTTAWAAAIRCRAPGAIATLIDPVATLLTWSSESGCPSSWRTLMGKPVVMLDRADRFFDADGLASVPCSRLALIRLSLLRPRQYVLSPRASYRTVGPQLRSCDCPGFA